MMRRWVIPLAIFLVIAGAAHWATLHFAPSVIMDKAMAMLEERGSPLHAFRLTPRMTPQTQTVVRPSPDLAYSLCRYDLAEAPNGIAVTMAAYDGYASLSFFDARTDNFFGARGEGQVRNVILLPPGADANRPEEIVSPTDRGVILIRRLAPTVEAYTEVEAVVPGDRCMAITGDSDA